MVNHRCNTHSSALPGRGWHPAVRSHHQVKVSPSLPLTNYLHCLLQAGVLPSSFFLPFFPQSQTEELHTQPLFLLLCPTVQKKILVMAVMHFFKNCIIVCVCEHRCRGSGWSSVKTLWRQSCLFTIIWAPGIELTCQVGTASACSC